MPVPNRDRDQVTATYLIRVLRVNVDLLVLFKPGVHLGELDLDEPVELVVVVKRSSSLRTAVADDDVVDVVLLGLESVDEILVRDVLCLEEVIWIVWLEPPAYGSSKSSSLLTRSASA